MSVGGELRGWGWESPFLRRERAGGRGGLWRAGRSEFGERRVLGLQNRGNKKLPPHFSRTTTVPDRRRIDAQPVISEERWKFALRGQSRAIDNAGMVRSGL